MRIFIICSKHFYNYIPEIKTFLEEQGHIIMLPNSFDAPMKEEEMKVLGEEAHRIWKAERLREQIGKVEANDAVFVLNFEKNGQKNYIGGATFLEIAHAFYKEKKIFFYNPLPENIFIDELKAMRPIVIQQDLSKIQ